MERIIPKQVGGYPVEGDPVEIVGRLGPKNDCIVEIVCGENRKPHRLTIRGKHVNIYDHTPEEIQEDYLLKKFHLTGASECARVKIWGEEWDFEIVP